MVQQIRPPGRALHQYAGDIDECLTPLSISSIVSVCPTVDKGTTRKAGVDRMDTTTTGTTATTMAAAPPNGIGQHTCPICGNQVVQSGKRGRPREFCTEECKEASAAITILQAWLQKIIHRLTPNARKQLRALLWQIANDLNTTKKERGY